jgi:hypothetical protein
MTNTVLRGKTLNAILSPFARFITIEAITLCKYWSWEAHEKAEDKDRG